MSWSSGAAATPRIATTSSPGEFEFTTRDFDKIAAALQADAGIYLPETKATLVYSRLVKRLRSLNLRSFQDYCSLIATDEGVIERQKMVSALTTNVTRFFRELHHFEDLKREIAPSALETARRGGRVRIWSAACSSGQEAFSIALSLLSVEPAAASLDIKILATDIDQNILAEAKRGIYAESALVDVPVELRRKYFKPIGDERSKESCVADELRELVAFRRLNLNESWPMRGQFEAIFCRNVVIYFDESTQQALWSRLALKLLPKGRLYIGHSERVTGPAASLLKSVGITTYQIKTEAVR